MKIRVTFDLDDEAREAIAARYGLEGKASREDCQSFLWAAVKGALEED